MEHFRKGSVLADLKVDYVLKEAYTGLSINLKPANISRVLSNKLFLKRFVIETP